MRGASSASEGGQSRELPRVWANRSGEDWWGGPVRIPRLPLGWVGRCLRDGSPVIIFGVRLSGQNHRGQDDDEDHKDAEQPRGAPVRKIGASAVGLGRVFHALRRLRRREPPRIRTHVTFMGWSHHGRRHIQDTSPRLRGPEPREATAELRATPIGARHEPDSLLPPAIVFRTASPVGTKVRCKSQLPRMRCLVCTNRSTGRAGRTRRPMQSFNGVAKLPSGAAGTGIVASWKMFAANAHRLAVLVRGRAQWRRP